MHISTQTWKLSQIWKLLLLLTAMNSVFISLVIIYNLHFLHDENSVLENLQVLLLAAGVLPYLFIQAKSPSVTAFNQLFALLCFSFFLRELDVEKFNIPELLKILGSGTGKIVLLAVLWGGLITALIVQRLDYRFMIRDFMNSEEFRLGVLVMILLAVSFIMDKQLFPTQFPRMYEELSETNAYFLMLLISIMRLSGNRFSIRRV